MNQLTLDFTEVIGEYKIKLEKLYNENDKLKKEKYDN